MRWRFQLALASLLAGLVCVTAGAFHSLSIANDRVPTGPESPLDKVLQDIIRQHGAANLVPSLDHLPKRTEAQVNLGRELFFSKILSGKQDVACASCHHPFLAGGDRLSLPVGEGAYDPDLLGPGRWHDWSKSNDPKSFGGPNVSRHSQTIFNAALYKEAMFFDGRIFRLPDAGNGKWDGLVRFRTPDSNLWQADPAAGNTLLSAQARFPVVSSHEMLSFDFDSVGGHDGARNMLIGRLREQAKAAQSGGWRDLFQKAFSETGAGGDDLISYANVQTALAAYQEAQIFIANDWYAYVAGDRSRLTEQQKQGAILFFKDVRDGGAGCAGCHQAPTFTDEKFHNIAVPQVGRGVQADGQDFGRRGVTQKDSDRFRFRTPSLLNVADTAPYGHSGSISSLREMIVHHLSPEASIRRFDFGFSQNAQLRHAAHLYSNARKHTLAALDDLKTKREMGKSKLASDISLSDDQVSALEAFLNALSDPCVRQPECVKDLIPDSAITGPDGKRLIAKFSAEKDGGPPKPLRPLEAKLVLAKAEEGLPPERSVAGGESIKSPGPELKMVETTAAKRQGCVAVQPDTNSGGFTFNEVAQDSGLTARHAVSWDLYNLKDAQRVLFSGGVAAGDVDGDCWPDIFYPTGDTRSDILYRNNQDGTFSDVSKDWGLNEREFSNGVTMADIDGDGDLDVVTTNILHPSMPSIGSAARGEKTGQSLTVYKNEDGQKFSVWTTANLPAVMTSWSVSFGDYDGDGDLDALTTHWRGPGLGGDRANHLWEQINAKASSSLFEAADKQAGLLGMTGRTDFTFAGSFADINHDGFSDMLMVADFEETQVYVNNGDGTFENVTKENEISDQNGMGSAIVDYDNDGDLDWFVSSVWDPNGVAEGSWGTTGNRLYKNENGKFVNVTKEAGVAKGFWGWGACFADFNNDAWPDLFHVNGFDLEAPIAPHLGHPAVYFKLRNAMREFAGTPSRLFISNRKGQFTESSAEWGITDTKSGRGAVCFDYDRDGDVDILVSNHQDGPLLYRNNARSQPNTNFINIALKGLGKNTRAVGAQVYVTAKGITQLKEISAGGGFLTSSPPEAHFGLGDAEMIDEIKVVWPRPNRFSSVVRNVPVNQFLEIDQAEKSRLSVSP